MNPTDEALDAVERTIHTWVRLPGEPGNPTEDLVVKIDILERILEIARLRSGRVVNRTRMVDLIGSGWNVDPAEGIVTRDASAPVKLADVPWPAPNERVPSELQTPLLLYLLRQYKRPEPIHKTIEEFVVFVRQYLTPFDVESTVTGVPRVMTNTRLAANTLRDWGLLQNARPVRYKSWELTHLGLLAGAALTRTATPDLQPKRCLRMTHTNHLAEPIMEAVRSLTRIENLLPTLEIISNENADVLQSLTTIRELVVEYEGLLFSYGGSQDLQLSKIAARSVLERIVHSIPVDSLADDLAVDQAIQDVLGK